MAYSINNLASVFTRITDLSPVIFGLYVAVKEDSAGYDLVVALENGSRYTFPIDPFTYGLNRDLGGFFENVTGLVNEIHLFFEPIIWC